MVDNDNRKSHMGFSLDEIVLIRKMYVWYEGVITRLTQSGAVVTYIDDNNLPTITRVSYRQMVKRKDYEWK